MPSAHAKRGPGGGADRPLVAWAPTPSTLPYPNGWGLCHSGTPDAIEVLLSIENGSRIYTLIPRKTDFCPLFPRIDSASVLQLHWRRRCTFSFFGWERPMTLRRFLAGSAAASVRVSCWECCGGAFQGSLRYFGIRVRREVPLRWLLTGCHAVRKLCKNKC